jgi:hypothetical protein
MTAPWLADVLRAAGCSVVEEGDWQARGTGSSFTPVAVMLHHDASPPGDSPTMVSMLIDGRPDLDGPLCQLWVDYDGVWHCIAAGRANHAGSGQWGPIPTDSGNRYSIGIETDHTTAEAWTPAQREAIHVGCAALLAHMGADPYGALCAHKEYAAGRKVDPDPADMDAVRHAVATYNPTPEVDMTPEDHDAIAATVESIVAKYTEGLKPLVLAGEGSPTNWYVSPAVTKSEVTGPEAEQMVADGRARWWTGLTQAKVIPQAGVDAAPTVGPDNPDR